jgi:predicted transcriptional regulator
MTDTSTQYPLELTSNIVSAYVTRNSVPIAELPGLIASVHHALGALTAPPAPEAEETPKATPAAIRKSITPDALISFIDGKPYKALKRHLSGQGMTPDAYRTKFGLPPTYPMVSEAYSAARAEMARSIGLGQIRRDRAMAKAAGADETRKEPAKRGRPRKAAAE